MQRDCYLQGGCAKGLLFYFVFVRNGFKQKLLLAVCFLSKKLVLQKKN